VAAFSGRVHYYEGHGMDVPALLPRVAHELGAETMVLTAAVAGSSRASRPERS
jgi:Purine nucleoside phosphorylase